MAAKPRAALGRGLSALLDAVGPEAAAPDAQGGPRMVAVGMIAPRADQPRKNFDKAQLAELTESVAAKGVLVPLLVRPAGEGRFELIAGERRWRAAQAAGLHEVPVVVRDMSDAEQFEAALIENVQRADLNPVEEAEGYRRLQDEFGHRQEDVARLTGKSRPHISNLMRILDLHPEVLGFIRLGAVSLGHAKVLLQVEPEQQWKLARAVTADRISVRKLEDMVKRLQSRSVRVRDTRLDMRDPDLAALEDHLEEATGLAVAVSPGPGAGGEVRIRYSNLEQLDGLVARLSAARG